MALALVSASGTTPRSRPHALRRALGPLLETAEKVLRSQGLGGADNVLLRLRVVPWESPLGAPALAPGVLEATVQALGDRRRLSSRYAADGGRASVFVLDPLGLVVRGPVLTLVARTAREAEPRAFPLHRFRSATVLDELAGRGAVDLDAFVAGGGLGAPVGGPEIALVVRCRGEAARALEDTPLGADQAVEHLPDGEVRVRATVTDDRALRAWLLGCGDEALVEEPRSLADAIAATARAVAALYPTPRKRRSPRRRKVAGPGS